MFAKDTKQRDSIFIYFDTCMTSVLYFSYRRSDANLHMIFLILPKTADNFKKYVKINLDYSENGRPASREQVNNLFPSPISTTRQNILSFHDGIYNACSCMSSDNVGDDILENQPWLSAFISPIRAASQHWGVLGHLTRTSFDGWRRR